MARSRRDSSPKREIHGALSYDFARHHTGEPHGSQVPASLLLTVHLSQTAIAGIFCWVCFRAYHGTLSPQMEAWWTACLVSLALAWMGALPLFASLWRFTPPIETRLSFWASYWLGVLALPVSILAMAVTALRRPSPGLAKRSRTHASLLVGVVTTWPLMQIAAYLACDKALLATLVEEESLSPYWSFVLVYGTCLALPFALTTAALLARRKRLVQAASAEWSSSPTEKREPSGSKSINTARNKSRPEPGATPGWLRGRRTCLARRPNAPHADPPSVEICQGPSACAGNARY